MKAMLIDPDFVVRREWITSNYDAAMTADRNFPIGWKVVVVD